MSKLGNILKVIHGQHVLNASPLADYYAARAARDATRIKDNIRRHAAIKTALHAYRVLVSYSGVPGDAIRILSHATGNKTFV